MKRHYFLLIASLAIFSACSSSTSAPLDVTFPNAVYLNNVSNLYEVTSSNQSVDLTWKDSNGVLRKLSDYHGKVILVTFWKSSQDTSDLQISSLDSAAAEMPDSLRAVGVATDNATYSSSFKTVSTYVLSHSVKLQVIVDSTGIAQGQFIQFSSDHAPGAPQTFVLDTAGSVHAILNGFANKNELEATVRNAFK